MARDRGRVSRQAVLHPLTRAGPLGAEAANVVYHVGHQMEAVEMVLHAHVERRRHRTLLQKSVDVEVLIPPSVGEPMNQRRIAMESEDDRPVRCE